MSFLRSIFDQCWQSRELGGQILHCQRRKLAETLPGNAQRADGTFFLENVVAVVLVKGIVHRSQIQFSQESSPTSVKSPNAVTKLSKHLSCRCPGWFCHAHVIGN